MRYSRGPLLALALPLLVGMTGCAKPPAPVAPRPARLEILSTDADVWGFEVFVHGVVHADAEPFLCQFLVGERALDAALSGDDFSATVPLESGANLVGARCQLRDGQTVQAEPVRFQVRLAPGQLVREQPPQADGEPPAWARDSVVYGVVPPLFGAPPLQAVRDALDGLYDLGVGALWLSPIFASPDDDYGYAVTDPFQVRPSFGTEQDLRELVSQAHARQMRVLLDLVPNHTSDEHPYYVQVQRVGRRSHYYDFYDRDDAAQVTHYFDWHNLPNLNFRNPEVARYTLASASHWVRGFAIDGYRVDAAWGIKERKPDFWPRFRAELKQLSPELFLLAEASARDPYYVAHGFDAAYDWSDKLGEHAWQHVFEARQGIAQRLHQAISDGGKPLDRVFRFLNNNDTGDRFITKHGEALTRVATTLLLTLPGIPCLYSFDEVGAEFSPYQQEQPIAHDNPQLRAFHKQLIALRRTLPALRGGGFAPLHVGESDEAYVYARSGLEPDSLTIVALNFADQPLSLTVALPDGVRVGRLRDALSQKTLSAQGKQLRLKLTPYDAQIWTLAR